MLIKIKLRLPIKRSMCVHLFILVCQVKGPGEHMSCYTMNICVLLCFVSWLFCILYIPIRLNAKKTNKQTNKQTSKKTCMPYKSGVCLSVYLSYVTLHHEMNHNVPDGHFHISIFFKVNSMLFTMVNNIFKSED